VIYGRDTGVDSTYTVSLFLIMTITTRIVVAIIRDSALVIIYHSIFLADLLFKFGNNQTTEGLSSIPTTNIIK